MPHEAVFLLDKIEDDPSISGRLHTARPDIGGSPVSLEAEVPDIEII